MKLIRLKINDINGFRSLQSGFEYHFRKEWQLHDEHSSPEEVAPFVCAGPNGSGKSNLLELLAAIFYHMECMYLENLPDSFVYDEEENTEGYRSDMAIPDAFELEYLIQPKQTMAVKGYGRQAHVFIRKLPEKSPQWYLLNHEEQEGEFELNVDRSLARELLPEYVLAYSSGENEILSLPFFKMRFVQYDEYWQALKEQRGYSGSPESSLVYLDNSFSQAILLSNLLFQNEATLAPFREEVGIDELNEFRIVLRQSVPITSEQLYKFDLNSEGEKQQLKNKLRAEKRLSSELEVELAYRSEIVKENPAILASDEGELSYRIHLTELLDREKAPNDLISKLKRCATSCFEDVTTDILYLDYYVNQATRTAFQNNFGSALEVFQSFQVLLTLNLYSVSEQLKADLYQSNSLYVSETVPSLPSDERVMRVKNFWVSKKGIAEPVLLKSFSDGEHQLLHTLGLCLLFRNTNSLFLLDEPETHFNPQWRASFISRLRKSLNGSEHQEMLITTHTPFLISDSEREKVLVFENSKVGVLVHNPEYNTLGASINKITMSTFDKRETIGGFAQQLLKGFSERSKKTDEDKDQLIEEINLKLGDSVEKVLLIKTILDSMEETE